VPQLPGDSAIHQTLDAGSAAFAARWRAWMSQFTQPQLLKLGDAYLGARLFHSSQMGGFSRRTLRHPAPLVFLSVGYLNTAHGRSLGIPSKRIEAVPNIGLPEKLPATLHALWEGKEPLTDANDIVLGPTGLFEAFAGLRRLTTHSDRQIAPEEEQAASSAIGKILRLKLGTKGIDWISEMPALRNQCASIEPLLLGKAIPGDMLVTQLPRLAALAETTDEALWEEIEGALAGLPK
jgi:hypothetical protein